MNYAMQNWEEELGLRLDLINNQTIRVRNQRELREKTYAKSRALPFEVEIKITADYLKAIRENQEAENEVFARLKV